MQSCDLRKEKEVDSIKAHSERKKEQYKSNPDIDAERTVDNYHLVQPQHKYYAEIMRRVEMSKCPVWQFKKAQRLDKQAEKIKMALENINAFNAGKKCDEALKALTD